MNAHVDVEAGRETFLGGSEVGAMLGLSPYKTPRQLWAEKTGRAEPEPRSEAAHLGHLLEPRVIELYQEETGKTVVPMGRHIDPAHEWRVGHPDGAVKGEDLLFEAKTCSENVFKYSVNPDESPAWGEPGTDEIPVMHRKQVLHYFSLTGFRRADVALYTRDYGRFFLYHVSASDAEVEDLVAREIEWWEKHVIGDTPPDATDPKDVVLMFPKNQDVLRPAGATEALLMQKYLDAKREKKRAEGQLRSVETALKEAIGSASGFEFEDERLVTWKADVNGTRRINAGRNAQNIIRRILGQ